MGSPRSSVSAPATMPSARSGATTSSLVRVRVSETVQPLI